MAILRLSRYMFTSAIQDEDGSPLYLTEREPYRFRSFPDNIRHVVQEGDWWPWLAHEWYSGLTERPAGLWWVICDFLPEPVIDPTIRPIPGTLILAPSERTVLEEIFSERRRQESNVP